uniref:G-protein coupled receptors family 1 profile domain-containing protein n=1 Tax=Periophthalmus magnuspinnatus TaxID=409849 RepID=A0A3B4B186_9GOBI
MDMEDYIYNYTYTDDYNFTDEEAVFKHQSTCFSEVMCVSLVIVNLLIFFLGLFGNALVIWIAGFRMKKTVNTTWYLSLAISDFIFCACLPITIASMVMDKWIFGLFMCKMTSFIMFVNMFGSIFLLVIISADRCVSVMFPVWAQNHRSVKMASIVVGVAWVLAIALSVPSAIYRQVLTHFGQTVCFSSYPPHGHRIVALTRFFVGFVGPLVIILGCYSVIILKLRHNRMTKSSKPFKVMTALVLAFFICWLPYHVFILLELNHHTYIHDVVVTGLQVGTSVATANSFLNPVLYVFMGNDFRQTFKSSMLRKMENAMGEEGRTTSRYLSRSSSIDTRASTHI